MMSWVDRPAAGATLVRLPSRRTVTRSASAVISCSRWEM
jgi:hypothetical protein